MTAWGPKSKGVTPLHLAAEGGHLGVMDELLERGANIDARTKGACGCKLLLLLLLKSILPCLCTSKILNLINHIDELCSSLKPGTPLHIAAKERRREAEKFLIENGAFLPPDINDSRFNPPLHYCPGLEWAYEEMKRLRQEDLSAGETSYSSES